ncbi:hypothetical protein B0H10DRAFT_1968378 [Mycena sp. CBHHK59/15]|nr:hypothetical protein B0H10DRAFT_1968378 [Mycena sp. CBHHK59/15]
MWMQIYSPHEGRDQDKTRQKVFALALRRNTTRRGVARLRLRGEGAAAGVWRAERRQLGSPGGDDRTERNDRRQKGSTVAHEETNLSGLSAHTPLPELLNTSGLWITEVENVLRGRLSGTWERSEVRGGNCSVVFRRTTAIVPLHLEGIDGKNSRNSGRSLTWSKIRKAKIAAGLGVDRILKRRAGIIAPQGGDYSESGNSKGVINPRRGRHCGAGLRREQQRVEPEAFEDQWNHPAAKISLRAGRGSSPRGGVAKFGCCEHEEMRIHERLESKASKEL